jgi:putative salt-induced outer membrane protein YdiY
MLITDGPAVDRGLHGARLMQLTRLVPIVLCLWPASAAAQAVKVPPPLWDWQVGASFVGTSGNSDTATIGADYAVHRRWRTWQVESTASAVRTTDHGIRTAERYVGALRGQRKPMWIISLTAGERAESDRLSGLAFRSILDAGLSYALVHRARWTLDGLTSLAWNHERRVEGMIADHPVGVGQLLSKILLSSTADSTLRFTVYPDFSHGPAYRSEAELTLQAAMTQRLALKLGYLWRYSNEPVPTFKKNDNTITASIVVRWKAQTLAAGW